MPTTFDNTVQISINPDALPVGKQGFGTAIVVDAASMTERVLFFETNAAAIAAQADGDITNAQLLAVQQAFAQSPRPAQVGAARGAFVDVAQVDTITVGGTIAEDDVFTLTVNGEVVAYQAMAADGVNDVAAGLIADGAGLTEPVTVGGSGAEVTLTADVAGDAFDVTLTVTSAAGTLTLVNTTANQSITEELNAILDENNSWFGFTLVSRAKKDLLRAAAWAETNQRVFGAQSSDADIKAKTADNLFETLKARSYEWTLPVFYSQDSEHLAFAFFASVLATDLDTSTTVWYDKTLEGFEPDVNALTQTEKSNIQDLNGTLYLTLGGVGATGAGKNAAGRFFDVITTLAVTAARVNEDLKQLRLDYSNRNSKIPYTDEGFAVVESKVRARLESLLRAGHFERTDTGSSPYVNMPLRRNISGAVATSRKLSFTFGALLAGGVYEIVGNGSLTEDPTTIELLSQQEV